MNLGATHVPGSLPVTLGPGGQHPRMFEMPTTRRAAKMTVGPRYRAQKPSACLTPAFCALTLKFMKVDFTPDQKAFVRQAIEAGRFHCEEDAVQEALSLWEERERTRAEILAAVDVAEASLARGEGRTITQQSMRKLAEEVKQRGRARLSAEQATPR